MNENLCKKVLLLFLDIFQCKKCRLILTNSDFLHTVNVKQNKLIFKSILINNN